MSTLVERLEAISVKFGMMYEDEDTLREAAAALRATETSLHAADDLCKANAAIVDESCRTALEQAIDDLRAKHGSYRAAARVLRVNHVYLHRLRTGKRDNPSPAIMRKLKLTRRVTVTYAKKEPTA